MSSDSEKHAAAEAALAYVEDGMVVGLGSGSTSLIFVKLLGERVKSGLKITGVPTSEETGRLAEELGIPLVSLQDGVQPDVDIDGSDEVDVNLSLIKGGGGKLLREKIVAFASKKVVIIVDSKKLVDKLGAFKLPVEVVPFSIAVVENAIKDIEGKPVLRKEKDGSIYITDENNWILDCDFGLIDDPKTLDEKLSSIPGIVEHGLFINLADIVLVGENRTVRKIEARSK
ncbi:MAG: ribose-5-phosphate isomerase RpiA [Candidatus Melainabacteria bacterium]|nr:ribose-5-phosphate isomerase RpiA [Candidatus Melainabacteria bacterium]